MIERIRGAMTGLRAKAQAQLRWFTSYTSTWLDATWPRIDFRRLVDDGYGKHAIVFACVQLYVRVMREPPLRVFDEDDEGERTPDLKHDLQALLRQPNAHMGEREFWAYWITYAAVGGLVCTWIERDRAGRPVGLWPMHRGQVSPIPSSDGWLAGWSFDARDGSKPVFLPVEDVIPWRWAVDPNNPLDAMPVLYAVARAVDTGAEAMRYIYALLRNDAVPRTALVAKGLIPPEVKKAMLEQFREQYGGDNRGMPMILEGEEASLERIGSSVQELGADALHSVPDAWITAGFGVPAVLIGTSGGLQRAIQGAPKEMAAYFVESVAVPMWADIADTFTRHLLWREYGGQNTGKVLAFDLSKVRALQEDKAATRRSILDGLRMRLLTVNEARLEDGKDTVAGGDVFLQPSGFSEVPLEAKAEKGGASIEVGKVTTLSDMQVATYGKPPIEAVRALAVETMGLTAEAAAAIFPDVVEEPPPEPTPALPGPVPPFAQDHGGDMPQPDTEDTTTPPEPPADGTPTQDATAPTEPLPPGAKALPLPSEVVIDESAIEDATRDWDRWAAKYAPDLVGMMNATVAKPKKGKR